jgi:peptidoglycan/xylan/chitin deacetylase (PgdA/CDA1 family)
MFPRLLSFLAEGCNSTLLFRSVKPLVIHPFYHTVSDVYLPHIHPLYIPKKLRDFENDLDFLLHRFDAISIHEVDLYRQNPAQLKKHAFHLSFDDGLRGVYEYLTPLLFRKGVPATIFVNKAFTDNKQLFYRHKAAILINKLNNGRISGTVKKEIEASKIYAVSYSNRHLLNKMALLLDVDFQSFLKTEKPYLTSDELKEMQNKGFTIGAHSIDHPHFGELNQEEQIRQITESCAFVKETFGEQKAYFSFPFSDENIPDSLFEAIENKVDMTFGITGIQVRNNGRHWGRIDMERNSRNARGAINKSFLKRKMSKQATRKHANE